MSRQKGMAKTGPSITVKPVYEITSPSLHISKGNSKIGGMWNISTLPGNSAHMIWQKPSKERVPQLKKDGIYFNEEGKILITNVAGTCGKNCDVCYKDCYAMKSVIRYSDTCAKAWGENTLLLHQDQHKFFSAIHDAIKEANNNSRKQSVAFFRWNVSGEIENPEQLIEMNNLALLHPEVTFGIYTKNYDALGKFFERMNFIIADNFIINVSEWHGVAAPFILKYGNKTCNGKTLFNIFEYDDSNKKDHDLSEKEVYRLKAGTIHCPAVTVHGKRTKRLNNQTGKMEGIPCTTCKLCFQRNDASRGVKHLSVYSH